MTDFRALVSRLVVLGVAAGITGCSDPIVDLTQFCPDDPTVQWCPEGEGRCAAPYECITYCLRYYPDGGDIPESGMGSWCGDSRLPEYGAFCTEHIDDVVTCPEWCTAHPGRCTAGDGDADIDSDADIDGDADVDTDADIADADPDVDPDPEPECTTHDQCLAADEARCDPGTGTCVACTEDAQCAHLPGTPACDGGVCYACSSTNESSCTDATTHCLAAEHRCVGCTEDTHCPDVAAARCDATTHECAPCTDDTPCARFTDAPHCDGSTCVQCTSYAHCLTAGMVCNYSTRLCVEACRPCATSTECESLGAGFVCRTDWTDPETEHCVQSAPVSYPNCERPWVLDRGVCLAPVNTTCLGVVEFGVAGCDPLASGPCGEDGIGGDGVCIEGGTDYCSYYCTDTVASTDCPAGAMCSGVPLACRLP